MFPITRVGIRKIKCKDESECELKRIPNTCPTTPKSTKWLDPETALALASHQRCEGNSKKLELSGPSQPEL